MNLLDKTRESVKVLIGSLNNTKYYYIHLIQMFIFFYFFY